MRCVRLVDHPIIDASTHPTIGTNIQGPSLIAAPPWLDNPLGRYYLYFADHKGSYIRLAFADQIEGPWRVHALGALQLADSQFLTEPPPSTDRELADLRARFVEHLGPTYDVEEMLVDALTPHIASPDVHLDIENQQVIMWFHGLDSLNTQLTRVATSADGVAFSAQPQRLTPSYLRMFWHRGQCYGMTMPGQFWRSPNGFDDFEKGPRLFERDMRHSGLWVDGDTLHVLWTRVGDAPESILHTAVDLTGDFMQWAQGDETLVMSPELEWEGSQLRLEPSRRSTAPGRVRQLRDPAVFREEGRIYVLYAGAGESAIGVAELEFD